MTDDSFTPRSAHVCVNHQKAGILTELKRGYHYQFLYLPDYEGSSISLTMPVRSEPYIYDRFPPFFDGLLPEGNHLEALLRQVKLDRDDYFSQLIAVGKDMVGAVSVEGPHGQMFNNPSGNS
jgi:serine/threonine-protein kinase HipA